MDRQVQRVLAEDEVLAALGITVHVMGKKNVLITNWDPLHPPTEVRHGDQAERMSAPDIIKYILEALNLHGQKDVMVVIRPEGGSDEQTG